MTRRRRGWRDWASASDWISLMISCSKPLLRSLVLKPTCLLLIDSITVPLLEVGRPANAGLSRRDDSSMKSRRDDAALMLSTSSTRRATCGVDAANSLLLSYCFPPRRGST